MSKRDKRGSIVVRKEEVVEGGHHGGAWKVAYADFVTAMMAFFLLMWLLNATTEEQRRGLADYFSPSNNLARTVSGFGQPFGGQSPNVDGTLISDRGAVQVINGPPHPLIDADDDQGDNPAVSTPDKPGNMPMPTGHQSLGYKDQGTIPAPTQSQAQGDAQAQASTPAQNQAQDQIQSQAQSGAKPTEQEIQQEVEKRERQQFERASQQIKEAVRSDPALADLAKQLMIDIAPEGLRIQLLDADRSPMFSTGSSALNDRAKALLTKVAPVLMRMSEAVAVAGHTDAEPYKGGDRSNWDLSAERANATRRLLVDAGLAENRIRSVTGNADRDPLIPSDPRAAANRRIAIVVLRDRPTASR